MITLDEILREGRQIWPEPMALNDIVIAMGVVYGDIARAARDHTEINLPHELGNIVVSTVRWIDDLGFDSSAAVRAAFTAQRAWIKR